MKPRTPGSVEDAIMRALGILGRQLAAEVAGKSFQYLYACGDPDDDTKRLPFEVARALRNACIDLSGEDPFRDCWGEPEPQLPHEVKPALDRMREFRDTSHAVQAGFQTAYETRWSRTDVIRALEAAAEHETSLRGMKADLEAMLPTPPRMVGGDRKSA